MEHSRDDQELCTACLLRQLLVHSIAGSLDVFHRLTHDNTDLIMELNERFLSRATLGKVRNLMTREYLKNEEIVDLVALLKEAGVRRSKKR